MEILIISIFLFGYIMIAFEGKHKIDKAPIALILGVSIWTILIVFGESFDFSAGLEHHEIRKMVEENLTDHLGEVAGILFFLIGAMSIVEVVDMHNGFSIITDKITTKKIVPLLWLICMISFFFSSVLDNLTTTIVMLSLLRKLIESQKQRWLFAGMVVVASNAGGAWSPIGDVTTTMLWISEKVTVQNIILATFIPSLVCLVLPLGIMSIFLKGNIRPALNLKNSQTHHGSGITNKERNIIFFVGVSGLILVPIFKTLTHLPPYVGMMLSLGILWTVTELLHAKKEDRHLLSVISGLKRIDLASVLFFLGVLLAIGGLETAGTLVKLATAFENYLGNYYVINFVIGALSSIVDNVPLVAAALGMYTYPTDHEFWEFLAYCAGTGGSLLIIGSASGVAAMGLERIPFAWYFKKISFWALIGYLGGGFTFILFKLIA